MKLILTLAALLTLAAPQTGDALYGADGYGYTAGTHPGVFGPLYAQQWLQSGTIVKGEINFKEYKNSVVVYKVFMNTPKTMTFTIDAKDLQNSTVKFSGPGQCGTGKPETGGIKPDTVDVTVTARHLTVTCRGLGYTSDGDVDLTKSKPISFKRIR